MNLTSPKYVHRLLKQLDIQPGKSLGQNFLIDANILDIIMRNAELESESRVLEIGPGLGVLTEEMLGTVRGVVAIEKDQRLCDYLEDRYGDDERFDLICKDALDLDLDEVLSRGVDRFVANLPYSVASRIMVDVFKATHKPQRIAVTLQDDVAARIAAEPGSKQYGLMAILGQRFYEIEIAKHIGRNCFTPRPRVGSALLVCNLRPQPVMEVQDEEFFLRLVKMAFTHRRKMIVNALRGAGFELEDIVRALCEVGIDEMLRPTNLTVADWCRLSNALKR